MPDTYQIVFLAAGDGSPAAQKAVAEKIATATKSAPENLLKQIERAPFIYKKGLPKAKADNVAAALNKMGAVTEVRSEGPGSDSLPGPQAAPGGFGAGNEKRSSDPAAFSFDSAPAPAPAAAPAFGGFDFGAPPSATPAATSGAMPGYDFDSPPLPSGDDFAEKSAGNSGFGNFGFGAPAAPARNDDFPIEEPSGQFGALKMPPAGAPAPAAPPPQSNAASGGGFDFSTAAATVAPAKKAAVSDVAVSRNADYAADAPKAPATPAKQPPKQKAAPETTVCPRCQAEVPVANECGSCGVLLSKAGEGAQNAPRRRGKAPVKDTRSPLIYGAIGAIALIAIVLGAFLGGAFNSIRLKMDAGKSGLLRQYSVSVPPPTGTFAEGVLNDPAKAAEIQTGFIDRSKAIDDEIIRLSALSNVAVFDEGAFALETETGEYVRNPGNAVLEEVRKVVAPYYPVRGAGIRIGGVTYMFTEVIELAGVKDNPQILAILSDAQIRERLKVGREQVVAAEAQRISNERATSNNVSFNDNFDTGLDPRWRKPSGSAVSASGARVRIIGQAVAAPQAPKLLTGEPDGDYVVKVTVSAGGGETRGGIVVVSPQGFIGVVKTRRGNSDQIVMVSDQGERGQAPAGRDVQLRLEKVGGQYKLSYWNGAKGSWTEVDQAQPAWGNQPGRQLGLIAFGGNSTFEFDDFSLNVSQ